MGNACVSSQKKNQPIVDSKDEANIINIEIKSEDQQNKNPCVSSQKKNQPDHHLSEPFA